MPVIPVGAQVFDLVFHPQEPVIYLGLLTGEIKTLRYDEEGQAEQVSSLRPSKRSCRGLALNEDGSRVYAVGKAKALHVIDTTSAKLTDTIAGAHQTTTNRIKRLSPNILISGDDDGVVKLWDTRKKDALREYTHHFDFISDFMWVEDKKQVVITSGDGTLSVIDIRASKTKPIAHSEDQEDELLSIVSIRGGEKTVVGTQLGILSIFNRNSGWNDCVDRVPGHPHSVDALCPLPSTSPASYSTVLTGSSDGLLRAVQLFPTKLIGVVEDHGDFPIERIAIELGGEGNWVGSVGHDESLHLTDLRKVFEELVESKGEGEGEAEESDDSDASDNSVSENTKSESKEKEGTWAGFEKNGDGSDASEQGEDSVDSDVPFEKSKRRKKEKDPLSADRKKKKRAKNEVVADPSFFSDL